MGVLTPKVGRVTRACFLVLSVLLWAFISYCYWRRPDACVAVTLWPAWVWFLPGVLLGMFGGRRVGLVLLAAWVLLVGAFSEEPWSLLRALHGPTQGCGLRVVTLNCAGGSAEAASEVSACRPDIVLLQESPGSREVEALGRRLFGKDAGVLCGLDASILAKGRVREIKLDRSSSFFVMAQVRLDNGVELYVVSTRLTPPALRLDLWSPECWRVERENRLLRAEEVGQIARQVFRLPDDAPILLGGDLNAPVGDGAFSGFRPRLRDTFRRGGRGWGNTVLNDFPVSRIDQIWTSKHFKALSVTARKTRHSDHRMLIADMEL
ncbi:MAG: endonuclease/exonuclease/phosphatase family protein [Armatimonadota bacterium]